MTPIQQALEALKPFAEGAGVFSKHQEDDKDCFVSLGSLRRARTAYEALSKYQEWVLVPREATPEMCEAVAFGPYTETSDGDEFSTFDYFSEENAADVWRDMIAAAKQHMEGE